MIWLLTNWKLGAAAIIGAMVAVGPVYVVGFSGGRRAVQNELKDQRITILKDGKKIDETVLAADDDGLCVLLGGCVQPDGGH